MAKLDDIEERLDTVERNIDAIERGIYGDSKNEVRGLIHVVNELHSIVKTVQNDRKTDKLKVVYFGMGAGFIISGIITAVKYWFSQR